MARPKSDPTTVLDASAVLAYLQREAGTEAIRLALQASACMSTVNLAEVCAKLVGRGIGPAAVVDRLKALGLRVVAFTEDDAMASGDIFPETKELGLSLGDRACLALSKRLGAPALTADLSWTALDLGIEIRLIR
jgi:PIN domain nuclease of toxin-antitoxin system